MILLLSFLFGGISRACKIKSSLTRLRSYVRTFVVIRRNHRGISCADLFGVSCNSISGTDNYRSIATLQSPITAYHVAVLPVTSGALEIPTRSPWCSYSDTRVKRGGKGELCALPLSLAQHLPVPSQPGAVLHLGVFNRPRRKPITSDGFVTPVAPSEN